MTRPAQPASARGFRSTIVCDARRSPRNSLPAVVMLTVSNTHMVAPCTKSPTDRWQFCMHLCL